MAFKKVTINSIKKVNSMSNNSFKNPALDEVEELKFKQGNTYYLRILPPNVDEATFGDDWASFDYVLNVHWGVGKDGKEFMICPNDTLSAIKSGVRCPACEARAQGAKTRNIYVKQSHYVNAVLMKPVEGVKQYKADKKLKVYTVRLPQRDVRGMIAAYYEDPDRSVEDITDLEKGCPVIVKVGSVTLEDGRKMPQYQVRIAEGKVSDISKYIDEEDVKDLRVLTRYIPTQRAYNEIYNGMAIKTAIELYGKIDTVTGKQIGGETSSAPAPLMDTKQDVLEPMEDVIDEDVTMEDIGITDEDMPF